VAVRAGAARPDVSTVEAFKRTLTNAKAVAMPGSTSGIYLINDLFPRLGSRKTSTSRSRPGAPGWWPWWRWETRTLRSCRSAKS
jgi:hypothetical protein